MTHFIGLHDFFHLSEIVSSENLGNAVMAHCHLAQSQSSSFYRMVSKRPHGKQCPRLLMEICWPWRSTTSTLWFVPPILFKINSRLLSNAFFTFQCPPFYQMNHSMTYSRLYFVVKNNFTRERTLIYIFLKNHCYNKGNLKIRQHCQVFLPCGSWWILCNSYIPSLPKKKIKDSWGNITINQSKLIKKNKHFTLNSDQSPVSSTSYPRHNVIASNSNV